MEKSQKIYVAGHSGMVGRACWRALKGNGYSNLVGRTSKDLDLRDQEAVKEFIKLERPTVIIDAAAKVGGIYANNTHPYEFLMHNMLIQNNLIRYAHEYDVAKFIFLGSSCIYPKFASQPLKEEYLLTSSLEPTNEYYAIAKISGVKLIESLRKQYNKNYLSLMPTNLYGPYDNFNAQTSHVLPAMIHKFHDAKRNNHSQVHLWGTGTPKREFLHVDDLADAVVFSLENDLEEGLYNVGFGRDIEIKELARIIQKLVGHRGDIYWDKSKPDGTPIKLLDSTKIISKGWQPKIALLDGLTKTYDWFLKNNDK